MMTTTLDRLWIVAGCLVVFVGVTFAQSAPAQSSTDEDVARRQLESGRAFVRQGNYVEALKDFKAVAETHGSSSVADNALLEIARYYLDTVGDTKEAGLAVDAILKTYPTSDSAPEAYLMAGRLAMANGHSSADLDAALANFERVTRLFPASDVVPRSLVLAAEANWYAGRPDLAMGNLMRVASEYPRDAAAADAYLAAGQVFLGAGDPVSAMEQLQQVRNHWPDSPAAAVALSRLAILYRLYVRPPRMPAFVMAAEPVGPARLRDVVALAMSRHGALYWANEQTVGVVTPSTAPAPGRGGKPRSLGVDAAGDVIVLEAATLRPVGDGAPVPLVVKRGTGALEPLKSAEAAVQVSNGDWLVMDDNERGIQRFARDGTYIAPFVQAKLSRLAVNDLDEIAGLDRDEKAVVLYDTAGKITGRVPLKTAAYELSNPVDLAYDSFGHLYVLDRSAIAVFSPYPAPAAPGSGDPRPASPGSGTSYRLVTVFAEPRDTQTGLRRATAFALDQAGAVYVYDDRAERVLVYR